MSNYEEFDKIAGDIKKGRLIERQKTTYLGLIAMYLAKITDVLENEKDDGLFQRDMDDTSKTTVAEPQESAGGMKSYLRFGNIPRDKISKVHRSDAVIRNEVGVSVWNCAFVNDVPFPLLPDNASESAMADYFYFLLGNKPVYLVTGTELKERGSANEPLLGNDIEVVKEYTDDYEYLKSILRR